MDTFNARVSVRRGIAAWSRRAIGLTALGILATGAGALEAQMDTPPSRQFFVGGGFAYSDPVGDFGLAVDEGWGFDAHFRIPLDAQQIVSLRVGAGFIEYGRERKRVCLSLTVGCRIMTDLVTTNNIFYMDFGPEVGVQVGPLRPYAGLAVGFGYFNTSSSLEDYDDFDYDNDVFETTNFDDATFAWSGRTGVQAQVSSGRHPLYLDFGAVYHDNGLVEYLTKGDIEDNPDGSITIFPTLSEAQLWSFLFGVSVGIGGVR